MADKNPTIKPTDPKILSVGQDDHQQAPPPPEEEGEGFLGPPSYPIRLSSLLRITSKLNSEARREFFNKSQEIFSKRNKTNYEKEWLADYLLHQEELYQQTSTSANPEPHVTTGSQGSDYSLAQQDLGLEYAPPTSSNQVPAQASSAVKPVDLNKLFVRPETFNGVKPPPREWLDQYEKAANSNEWSDQAKVKYMATFLKDTAYSWLTEVVPMDPATKNTTDWASLRRLFVRCYLGESDRQSAKRELDRAIQRDGEKAAQFIPRMLQMIRTLDPERPQDVITDDIRHKLLPEYQEKLTMFELKTIQHLYNACTKIEAGMAASKAASRQRERLTLATDRSSRNRTRSPAKDREDSPSNPSREKSASPAPARRTGSSSPGTRSGSACFRCGRNNHWAKDCRAQFKLDGSPCEDSSPTSREANKDKSVRFEKSVSVIDHDESLQTLPPPQPSPLPSAAAVPKDDSGKFDTHSSRSGGRNFICSIDEPRFTTNNRQPLPKHTISCNGVVFEALVDTGAVTCAVDSDVARQHGWTIRAATVRLFHALGEQIKCQGYADVTLSLTLSGVTRTICQPFIVVEDLCARIIVGVDAIRRLNLIINLSGKPSLSFAKREGPKGVRAMATILPPRSCNLITARVDSSDELVVVMPFGFDNSVHVSHSLCSPTKGEVLIQIVNSDVRPVELPEGMQVASFAPVMKAYESEVSRNSSINAIVPIEESGDKPETVLVGDNLNQVQVEQLKVVLKANIDAFSLRGQIGLSKLFEHSIELLPDAKPFAEPVRRHSIVHTQEAERQVQEMLRQGIIEESSSPWASEYVMVKKKTGDWRMCVDFRRLNSLTKKNSYPLPNIEECLEALAGKAYFSKLDFASGYWQMPVARDSRELTAFRTGGGLYQFKVMPFGLTNAPASFQKMINLMFAGLKGLNLQVFLDDVCLATRTWDEHLSLLDIVLGIVRSNNLKLKGSKCEFGKSEITFLGHKISTQGIMQDPDKLRAFKDLPRPRNVSEVRRVLGAFGYYRRFVYNFSALAEPIINLTRKDVDFVWGPEQDQACTGLGEA